LLALSFPKFGHPALAWVALVPLLAAIGAPLKGPPMVGARPISTHRALRYGLVTGVVWFIGTLYWLSEVMVTFGGLPTAVAWFAALLLIVYLALFPAAAAAVVARACARVGPEGLLVMPMAWIGSEYLRGHLLTGFPWVPLGNAIVESPIAQIASAIGIYGLSGLVALPATALVYAWSRRGVPAIAAVLGSVVLVGGVWFWGAARIGSATLTSSGTPIRVGLVQGNVEQGQKWNPALADEIFTRYLDLSRDAVRRGARLVVWPESSTPFMFEESPALSDTIRRLAIESQTTFLVGSDQVERDTPPRYYNSAFLVQPNGAVGGTYRKMHLVPFGEYVPFKKIFAFASPLVEAAGDFAEGGRITVFPVAGGTVSTAICYEVVFPELARGAVLGGSRLLSTITNDAWYGRSSAPWQHFDQARMRAIEQGRFLIRAANTGISGIVDPYGRVLARSALFEPAVVIGEVRFLEGLTVYARMGDALSYACLLLSALVCFWPSRR
jgi:apolipoprotein N-acyltransferase